MAKGWWINLLLLAVVLAGGGGLWWADQQDTARKQEEEAGRKVSDLAPASITGLRFQGGDRVVVVLERQEGQWRAREPAAVAVDGAAVDNLLGVLAALYERKVAAGQVDAATFGLDQPGAVLTVTGAEGRSLTLTAGSVSPASSHRYVRIGEDGPVVMLASDKAAHLMVNGHELRQRVLFGDLERSQVDRLEMHTARHHYTVTRGTGGLWKVAGPVADVGHAQRIEAWLDSLLLARGTTFRAASPPESPEWRLVLAAGERVTRRVTLWRDKEEILAQREGEPDAMVLPKYLAADLDKPVLELVDLRALSGGVPERLTVTWQGKSLEVDKKDGQWPLPAWSSVEESMTRDAVEAMVAVGEAPVPVLTVLAGQGESLWKVTGWKEGADFVLAPPDRPVRLRLSSLQSESLEKSLQAILEKQ